MRLCVTLACCLGLLATLGCEQRVPKEALGTVVFEVPAVPGSEKPPPLPGLDETDHSQATPAGKHL